jgi:methylmalonyl-CoA mutase C-terminal domain/subunit
MIPALAVRRNSVADEPVWEHRGAWHNPAMPDRPIKVLIAKPGLDGHDRGAKVLARGLRDEGFEVVYTGLRQTPEMIATAALQEDVDVVGLSILSGAHMTLLPRITKLLQERGLADVLVTAGGIIPDDDVPALAEAGVSRVFGPGTTIAEVAEYLRANARPRE